MKQAALITLGCKVNSFDTAVIWQGLEGRGYKVIDSLEVADLYIFNTCTVTNSASSHSRQLIRKAKKLSPDSTVVVTGCYAQVEPEEVSAMHDVDYVVGNEDKEKLLDIIDNGKSDLEPKVLFNEQEMQNAQLTGFRNKSRAFLKVQDGCEAYCTYCIIPYARGNSRSLAIDDIVSQVLSLDDAGHKEIVLTGIHLGAYGLDLNNSENFLSLLKRLESLNIDARFRISSIEPTEIDDEMVEFLTTSKKICRHLHIPLQSGDDDTLSRMGRKYNASYYRSKIEKIASAWKGVSIGADIMAGFPGEDEKAFENGCDLIKSLPISYLHVFPYSIRKGTPAATMAGHVKAEEKKRRCKVLREISEDKKRAFCQTFIGERLTVVKIEDKENACKTLSDNYIEIYVNKQSDKKFFNVEITGVEDGFCRGIVCN